MKTKYLVLAAFGAAIILLLTTEKGEELREDMAEQANKMKKRLKKLADETGSKASDLKSLIAKEIEGLGSDARDRIMSILDEGGKSAKKVKGKVEDLA